MNLGTKSGFPTLITNRRVVSIPAVGVPWLVDVSAHEISAVHNGGGAWVSNLVSLELMHYW